MITLTFNINPNIGLHKLINTRVGIKVCLYQNSTDISSKAKSLAYSNSLLMSEIHYIVFDVWVPAVKINLTIVHFQKEKSKLKIVMM